MLSLSDSDFPTTLQIPDTVDEIHKNTFRYEVSDSGAVNYKKMVYKSPLEFTTMMLSRTSTDSNIDTLTVKGTSTPLLVFNDKAPTYWTSYDETYLVLDSYKATVESTLQGAKSIAYCTVMPEFDDTDDDFVPVCPAKMFPTLLAESKKACFFYLKQSSTPIDEKRSLRGLSILKQDGNRAHERKSRPRFGRGR
jgi:hypothetical protein